MARVETTGLVSWDSFEKIGTVPVVDAQLDYRDHPYPPFDITQSSEGFLAVHTEGRCNGITWNRNQGFPLDRRQVYLSGTQKGLQTTVKAQELNENIGEVMRGCRIRTKGVIVPDTRSFELFTEGEVPGHREWIARTIFTEAGEPEAVSAELLLRNANDLKSELNVRFDKDGNPEHVKLFRGNLARTLGMAATDATVEGAGPHALSQWYITEPQAAFTALAGHLFDQAEVRGIDMRDSAIASYRELARQNPNPIGALVFRRD